MDKRPVVSDIVGRDQKSDTYFVEGSADEKWFSVLLAARNGILRNIAAFDQNPSSGTSRAFPVELFGPEPCFLDPLLAATESLL